MQNKERQAETKVDSEQMPIDTTSSPNAAKPHVSGSAIYSEAEVWEFLWDAVCFSKTPDLINETNTVIIHQKIKDRFEASKKHFR